MYICYYESPIGILKIVANKTHIKEISKVSHIGTSNTNEVTDKCIKDLGSYFSGDMECFKTDISMAEGTLYQQKVWEECQKIPYGHTISYKELSERVAGNAKHSRAVANALHNNPILLIIPCHRVVGSNGSLTGFAAGLDAKDFLINHENKIYIIKTEEITITLT